eukprot:m.142645 g.142645  ORF g.142645 m.142645 type:complete len:271 (+) comp11590_c3_seq1:1639-2451(+)
MSHHHHASHCQCGTHGPRMARPRHPPNVVGGGVVQPCQHDRRPVPAGAWASRVRSLCHHGAVWARVRDGGSRDASAQRACIGTEDPTVLVHIRVGADDNALPSGPHTHNRAAGGGGGGLKKLSDRTQCSGCGEHGHHKNKCPHTPRGGRHTSSKKGHAMGGADDLRHGLDTAKEGKAKKGSADDLRHVLDHGKGGKGKNKGKSADAAGGEGGQRETATPPPIGPLVCAWCKKERGINAFSGAQRKKPSGTGWCRQCKQEKKPKNKQPPSD